MGLEEVLEAPVADTKVCPYDVGFTVHEACAADPRFSYSLFVPPSALESSVAPKLIVSVHGTGRQFERSLSSLAEFARANNCIVMCPLFSAGVSGDRNLHGYKYLIEGDIRYDLVLLAMIDEIASRYGKDFSKFALSGFSGGGHFVHRFLLLHPTRLSACSIGAPGSVTLIDPTKSWWVGTKNTEEVFGVPVDLPALRQVRVHMAVGDKDLETWEITHRPGGRYWMDGANAAGRTRPERLASLRKSFEDNGIDCAWSLMPGTGHDEIRFVEATKDFFMKVLPTKPKVSEFQPT